MLLPRPLNWRSTGVPVGHHPRPLIHDAVIAEMDMRKLGIAIFRDQEAQLPRSP